MINVFHFLLSKVPQIGVCTFARDDLLDQGRMLDHVNREHSIEVRFLMINFVFHFLLSKVPQLGICKFAWGDLLDQRRELNHV
jgi:hypothetical protein